ncbi:mitochondrial ribosomal protein l27 [Cystoisospora suis]|uniref:Mitochondrial ribosomal protein l27 n=1 Tax=Cystoisospora suis TaxID=483139 RepID=A0A2C6K8K2_9APIC|nr:mitochondrial ribosomal protein l27 [Cystoisospora suis]
MGRERYPLSALQKCLKAVPSRVDLPSSSSSTPLSPSQLTSKSHVSVFVSRSALSLTPETRSIFRTGKKDRSLSPLSLSSQSRRNFVYTRRHVCRRTSSSPSVASSDRDVGIPSGGVVAAKKMITGRISAKNQGERKRETLRLSTFSQETGELSQCPSLSERRRTTVWSLGSLSPTSASCLRHNSGDGGVDSLSVLSRSSSHPSGSFLHVARTATVALGVYRRTSSTLSRCRSSQIPQLEGKQREGGEHACSPDIFSLSSIQVNGRRCSLSSLPNFSSSLSPSLPLSCIQKKSPQHITHKHQLEPSFSLLSLLFGPSSFFSQVYYVPSSSSMQLFPSTFSTRKSSSLSLCDFLLSTCSSSSSSSARSSCPSLSSPSWCHLVPQPSSFCPSALSSSFLRSSSTFRMTSSLSCSSFPSSLLPLSSPCLLSARPSWGHALSPPLCLLSAVRTKMVKSASYRRPSRASPTGQARKPHIGVKRLSAEYVWPGVVLVKQRKIIAFNVETKRRNRHFKIYPGENVKVTKTTNLVALAHGRVKYTHDVSRDVLVVNVLPERREELLREDLWRYRTEHVRSMEENRHICFLRMKAVRMFGKPLVNPPTKPPLRPHHFTKQDIWENPTLPDVPQYDDDV